MLRAEIRLAERLGVSPRRLWGEEPVTRLTPDGEGGFLVEREPEFTHDDIELFEAARVAEESYSPRGFLYTDEVDPKNSKRFKAGDEQGLPTRNFAISAEAAARKKYEKTYPDADMSGLSWPLRLVD